MNYANLGRTGLQVSRLCLGTMNFGPRTTEADSFAIMDKALELGFNFVDTANRYGGEGHAGRTEEIIGRWLKQGGRREKIALATKLYGSMGPGENDRGLSAYHIRAACDESLRRLGTDHIDLYQMHHVERTTPWEEIFQAMEVLVQQGKILYLGSSNFAAWDIAVANMIAFGRHFLGIVSEQSIYNLSNRMIELEVLPCCKALGVGVIPWSPLGGGLLGGVLKAAKEGRRAVDDMRKKVDERRPQLEKWEQLCKEMGEDPGNVAMAWLLANPAVTAPIIGPRTIDQLTGVVQSLEIEITDEISRKIDEIWPGPGGAAPQAYAW